MTRSRLGDILVEEFMEPMNVLPITVANALGSYLPFFERFLEGENRLSISGCIALGGLFNTTAEFWLNLQHEEDKRNLKKEMSK